MAATMGQPGGRRQEPLKADFGHETAPPAMVNHY